MTRIQAKCPLMSKIKYISVEKGFTLLELLIVLSILSILLLFTTPFTHEMLMKHEEHTFIETFEYDLLHLQSLASVTSDRVRMYVDEDKYHIYKGNRNSLVFRRTIPKGISIDLRMRNNISFDQSGRIRHANYGGIKINTTQSTYDVIFPLGKGRSSIVKQ